MSKPRRRALFGATICALALTGASAGPALGGEITGNGKPTGGPAHANSICVFSGKNDDPGAALDGPNGPGGPSQSYGQEVRLGLQNPHEFNPGAACRGGSNFARE